MKNTMNRVETFNTIKSEINGTVGINPNHEMAIFLMARTFRKVCPWHTELVATANSYSEAVRISKELETKYAQEFKDNRFTVCYCTYYAYSSPSGQVSNEAYDASKRY